MSASVGDGADGTLEGTAHGARDALDRERAQGLFSSLDVQFARRISAIFGETRPGIVRTVALVSRQESGGHVCADLARLDAEGLVVEGSEPGARARRHPARTEGPGLDAWIDAIATSPLVDSVQEPTSEAPRPLVLDVDGRRLYLARSFEDERALARHVRERATAADHPLDRAGLEPRIDRLVGDARGAERLRAGLRTGLARPLTIVTGGPGTGKTTWVVRLVALLIETALARGGAPPAVRLLAPTGRAAAALAASFARQRAELDVGEDVRAALPTSAQTIHRALRAGGRPDAFGRRAPVRLDDDVVVVDEASMVDLASMARLFESCGSVGRVVLLGDPDQLASVEAGAVLAELCRDREVPPAGSRPSTSDMTMRRPVGLRDGLVTLVESHRFAAAGGIGRLAEAIRTGDADAALALLDDPAVPEVERRPADDVDAVRASLAVGARALGRRLAATDDPAEKLARMASWRVLCAHRRGALGVEALCAVLDEVLAAERGTSPRGEWWPGRMLLVTRNAADQDLWNGDVGLVEATGDGLRALFGDGAGGVRHLPRGRLPATESAVAMSVHKSQGSEFDTVDLVLGAVPSRLMTRELLYTGVTRARAQLRIHGGEDVVRSALERRASRDSGLAERLAGDPPR